MKGILKKWTAIAAASAISAMLMPSTAVFAEGSQQLAKDPGFTATDYAAMDKVTTTVVTDKKAANYGETITEEQVTQAPYRPYLEWRDRTQFNMEAENVIYVYAKEGETVQLASNVKSASKFSIAAIVNKVDVAGKKTQQYTYGTASDQYERNTTDAKATIPANVLSMSIAVTLPDPDDSKKAVDPIKSSSGFVNGHTTLIKANGDNAELSNTVGSNYRTAIYMFKPTNAAGYIANQKAEKDRTYTPIEFKAPIEGTYAVRFLSSDYGTQDIPGRPASPFTHKYAGRKVLGTTLPEDNINTTTLAEVNGTGRSTTTQLFPSSSFTNGKGDGTPDKLATRWTFYNDTEVTSTQIKLGGRKQDSSMGRVVTYTPSQEGSITVEMDRRDANSSRTLRIEQGSNYIEQINPPADETTSGYVAATLNGIVKDTPVLIYSTHSGGLNINRITFTSGSTDTPTPPTPAEGQLAGIKTVSDSREWNGDKLASGEYDKEVTLEDDNTLAVLARNKKISKNGSEIQFGGGGSFDANGDMTRGLAFMPGKDGYVTVGVKYSETPDHTSQTDDRPLIVTQAKNNNNPDNIIKLSLGDDLTADADLRKMYVRANEPVYIYAGTNALNITSIKYTPITEERKQIAVTQEPNEGVLNDGLKNPDKKATYNSTDKCLVFTNGGTNRKVTYKPTSSGRIRVKVSGDSQDGDKKEQTRIIINQCGTTTEKNFSENNESYYTDWVYVTVDQEVSIYTSHSKMNWKFYELDFIPTKETVEQLPTNITVKTGEDWKESDATVAAWDVNVKEATNGGRVWSDLLFMNMGNHRKGVFSHLHVLTEKGFLYDVNFNGMQPYSFMFYSNNRGFLLDPYSIYSDPSMETMLGGVGTKLDRLMPLEHSFFSHEGAGDVGAPPVRLDKDANGNALVYQGKDMKTSILGNYEEVDPDKDATHMMFFQKPLSETLKFYTGKEALKGESGNEIPSKSDEILQNTQNDKDVTYVGLGGASKDSYSVPVKNGDKNINAPCGTAGVGGRFEVKITEARLQKIQQLGANTISIKLDFSDYQLDSDKKPVLNDDKTWYYKGKDNNNIKDTVETAEAATIRKYEDNNIVTLSTVIDENNAKTYHLAWDGRDAYGNNVPWGGYEQVIQSFIDMGTAHFPLLDAEYNPNGFKIKMENDNSAFGTTKDKVYYNNDAVSPKTNPKANSAWYFRGVSDNTKYPSQLGDGLNMLGGVSSNADAVATTKGAMSYNDYIAYDRLHSFTTVNDNQNGYGNFNALDMWSKYEVAQPGTLMSIGVRKIDGVSPYVSFVATNGTVNDIQSGATDEDKKTFDKSHVAYQKQRMEGNYDQNQGKSDIFGNTISTGYLAKVNKPSDTTTNSITWEIKIPVTGTGTDSDYGATYVKLSEEALASAMEAAEAENVAYGLYEQLLAENAVQFDNSSDETDSIADEPGLDGEVQTEGDESGMVDASANEDPENFEGLILEEIGFSEVEMATVAEGDTKSLKGWTINVNATNPVLKDPSNTSIINKGNIYKVNTFTKGSAEPGKEITLKLKQSLATAISGSGDFIFGLVIDNLYAPSSRAIIGTTGTPDNTFVDVNNPISVSSSDGYKDAYNGTDGKGEGQGKLGNLAQ